MRSLTNLRRRIPALALFLSLGLAAGAYAQFDPDPAIFDAGQNGAGSNGGRIQSSRSPLGGSISVVNEANLPPMDGGLNMPQISINGPSLPQLAGMTGGRSGGSSSSIPMGGSSGGGMGGQSSPFPMPPSQSSQGQGQQSQMPMPPSSQQQQGAMQSQGGMPPQSQSQSQSQSGSQSNQQMQGAPSSQQGSQSQSPLSSQMPPAPPEQQIGDQAAQIDPNGELTQQDGESGETGEMSGGEEQAQRKARAGQQAQQGGQEESEGDGQAMPEDIGGTQNNKRGKGTIDDVAVPANL